jgi:hypothetical protein
VTSSLEGNSLKVSGINAKGGALINRTIYNEVYKLIKTAVKGALRKKIEAFIFRKYIHTMTF